MIDTIAKRDTLATSPALPLIARLDQQIANEQQADRELRARFYPARRPRHDYREYVWERREEPATVLCLSRVTTETRLASLLDSEYPLAEAKILLDVAGADTLHCRGWLITGAPGE